MKTIMPTHDILVTGFGPFPGVDVNVSAEFAESICARLNAQQTSSARADSQANAAHLSVNWLTVSEQITCLYAKHQPALAIHFGVCSTAKALVVEQQAYNGCDQAHDAEGCQSTTIVLQEDGADVLQTRLPVKDILAECRASSVSIMPSEDAGRYLCNAAYYTSLAMAADQKPASDALFIHIPATLKPDTPDWQLFVAAALDVINGAMRWRVHWNDIQQR